MDDNIGYGQEYEYKGDVIILLSQIEVRVDRVFGSDKLT